MTGAPVSNAAEQTPGGKKDKGTRDPTFGMMFALSILISFRNPLVNLVQSATAVFLFACSAHKTVYQVFNRIGMSISHSTLHGHLKDLGESSRAALKALGCHAYESSKRLTDQPQQYFMLVFDNVNKYHAVSQRQTIAMKNEMKNGTVATAVVLEDIPPDTFDPKPYMDNIKWNDCAGLTIKALFDDIEDAHLSRVGIGMVMRILCAYIPALSGNLHSQVEAHFQSTENYAKHPLCLHQSIALPFGTSSIEENTPCGTSNVMHDLVGTQMEMQPEWFDNLLVLAAGDQLSIKQLETAKKCKSAEKSVYKSCRWVLPMIQLWHMKLAYLRSIFRVHWFNTVQSCLFGLHHGADALGRHINPTVNDFYACHNAAKTIFETMVLTATFVVIHKEAKRPLPTDNIHHMIMELSRFFKQGAPFHKCSLEHLETLAEHVYKHFMTTQAYHKTLCLPETLDSDTLCSNILKSLQEDSNARQGNLGAMPSKISSDSLHSNSDQMLGNLVLFMWDTFMYLEFASAIPQGDVGWVMEVIKNYGKELLEMACRFMFEYPAKLQAAILNNWLINPSGLNGHWQENDFFQEHSNKAIKTVFNTKTSDWDSPFLRDTVSVNIRGLSQLKDNLLRVLGLAKTGSGTSKPDYSADINVLAAHYLASNTFTLHPGHTQDALATDMFTDGYSRMSSLLPDFLEKSTTEWTRVTDQGQLDQEPDAAEVEEAGDGIPLAPLIMEDGVLRADEQEIVNDS
ncbi:unnamed protein product [Rhizoctonia solani]|uniref:DUF6589 domain-containing protein n=1 Tax=Rhizoctonia solani TaxID=456999 RepID=A0A8H3AZV3_9AGAM|nr:unnamed protein product [Rhizoctonia solani]